MGSSSHIHGQIRGHLLGEYPHKPVDAGGWGTRGGRRVGEHLPHPQTTLGTSPTPNLVPTPVAGHPRGPGVPGLR